MERYDQQSITSKLSHIIDPKSWYGWAISVGYYALVD